VRALRNLLNSLPTTDLRSVFHDIQPSVEKPASSVGTEAHHILSPFSAASSTIDDFHDALDEPGEAAPRETPQAINSSPPCSESSCHFITGDDEDITPPISPVSATTPYTSPEVEARKPEARQKRQSNRMTSCLQCVLKKMPCDGKVPICTRCKRASEHLCLAQRFISFEEARRLDLAISAVVLARRSDEDDEIWAEKLRREIEVGLLFTIHRSHRYSSCNRRS